MVPDDRISQTGETGVKGDGVVVQAFDEETLERLAEEVHKVWMDGRLRAGWQLGPVIDKTKKIHSCLVPYEQLSEADKESDRDMVRGIPTILAAAGYGIVKVESTV